MDRQHWQDWVVALVGAWLIVATWLFDFAPLEGMPFDALNANFILCGVLALAIGFSALAAFRPWEEWLNLMLGAWLVVSPWVLGFAGHPMAWLNAELSGFVIVVAASWTMIEEQQEGRA